MGSRRGERRARRARRGCPRRGRTSEAAALLAAQDGRHWNPDVVAAHGAVNEGRVEWLVARAHLEALVAALEQRHSEALRARAAEQTVGVLQVEPDANHDSDGRERDVALVERRPNPNFVAAPLDDSVRADERRRIGARVRAGQPEARDQRAVGEARQEVAALLVGAVAHEQLTRPQRVWHGDRRVRLPDGGESRVSRAAPPQFDGVERRLRTSNEWLPILARTEETQWVEKPLPPHSLGIFMAKKPLSRIKSHASAVMYLELVTSKSSTILQSSSTSLSRKACSSSVSTGVYVSSRCCRLGEPVKMSRSKPTVPPATARREPGALRRGYQGGLAGAGALQAQGL